VGFDAKFFCARKSHWFLIAYDRAQVWVRGVGPATFVREWEDLCVKSPIFLAPAVAVLVCLSAVRAEARVDFDCSKNNQLDGKCLGDSGYLKSCQSGTLDKLCCDDEQTFTFTAPQDATSVTITAEIMGGDGTVDVLLNGKTVLTPTDMSNCYEPIMFTTDDFNVGENTLTFEAKGDCSCDFHAMQNLQVAEVRESFTTGSTYVPEPPMAMLLTLLPLGFIATRPDRKARMNQSQRRTWAQ
jgi:hypothetical protein